MPIPVTLPSCRFRSVKDCRAAVRREVDPFRDSGQVFESELVSELLVTRHYALKPFGDRFWPRLFRWSTYPGLNTPEYFMAEFKLLGWRGISFNRAILGWELNDFTLDGELARDYRRKILPQIFDHRDRYPHCQVCGAPMRDVHHFEPTFHEIAQQVTALLDAEERARVIRTHDWFDQTKYFQIPEKCSRELLRLHQIAQLMSLCKDHHDAAHKEDRHG